MKRRAKIKEMIKKKAKIVKDKKSNIK